MKEVKEFTIDRARWLVGDHLDSALYRETDRKMCCLGFYARAAGAQVLDIRGKCDPDDAMEYFPGWLADRSRGLCATTDEAVQLIKCNDDPNISNAVRERRIRDAFAKHDVRVKFIGKYPPKK